MVKVSCIMPTANRAVFAAQSIAMFHAQDYADKELVIIDDGDQPLCEQAIDFGHPDIVYRRMDGHGRIGGKRNVACSLAKGPVIVHWDDDDWQASWRLSYQVNLLLAGSAEINGLDQPFYSDGCNLWEYGGREPWLYGATFCYFKSVWQRRAFDNIQIGEDTNFVMGPPPLKTHALPHRDFFVARIHPGNSSFKDTRAPEWRRLTPGVLPEWFFKR